jgi:lysyl-tRNA synthetase class 2
MPQADPSSSPPPRSAEPPSACRSLLEARDRVRREVRRAFEAVGSLEVDTPVLSQEILPEPQIDPLEVRFSPTSAGYLQPSPEPLMKRLLAAGAGPIHQFARAFRAGERGRLHDVEFVLVEWYAPGTSLDDAAHFIERLCRGTLGTEGIERVDCREAFLAHAGIDPLSAPIDHWRAVGGRLGQSLPEGHPDSIDAWFELLLSEVVGPALGHRRPTLLEAWPASQAAFARIVGSPAVARRFELFVQGVELANGWEEETCPRELERRIDAANRIRLADGRGALPLPRRFLGAHAAGMPQGVGAALGFDRLVMLATQARSIDEVRGFSSATA